MKTRWEYEAEIVNFLSKLIDCTISDAQGIVDAHDDLLELCYCNDDTVEQAALIIDKTSKL